jgi:VanZ family protein
LFDLNSIDRQRALKFMAWACLVVVAILSLVPGNERPHTFMRPKMEHFVAYAGTGLFFAAAYQGRWERWLAWSGLALASVIFEILQNFTPGRSPSVMDAVASTSGMTLGMLIGAYVATLIAS